jgi:hypothetical protein
MKYIKTKNIKVGEEYYFVDDDFRYNPVLKPIVSKQRINKIIGNQYSTKNPGDRYEVERIIGFKTQKEAIEYAIKQVKEHRKWLVNSANLVIELLEEDLSPR